MSRGRGLRSRDAGSTCFTRAPASWGNSPWPRRGVRRADRGCGNPNARAVRPKRCRRAVTPWANFRISRPNAPCIDPEGQATWRRSGVGKRRTLGDGAENLRTGFTDRSRAYRKCSSASTQSPISEVECVFPSWRTCRLADAKRIASVLYPVRGSTDVPPRAVKHPPTFAECPLEDGQISVRTRRLSRPAALNRCATQSNGRCRRPNVSRMSSISR